jgi:two-component system KDP operon response regulator KdpE
MNVLSTSNGAQPRVLIVEPDRHYLGVLARRIGQAGYRIASAAGAQEALAEMHRSAPDVLIAELTMKGTSGVELVSMVRGDPVHTDLPMIMMGGRSEAVAAVRALHAGADDVVRKPFHIEVLVARIARQIDRARSVRELRDANATLDARVVTRALALGELTERLHASEAECRRLSQMIRKSA